MIFCWFVFLHFEKTINYCDIKRHFFILLMSDLKKVKKQKAHPKNVVTKHLRQKKSILVQLKHLITEFVIKNYYSFLVCIIIMLWNQFSISKREKIIVFMQNLLFKMEKMNDERSLKYI